MNKVLKYTLTSIGTVAGIYGSIYGVTKVLSDVNVREIKTFFRRRSPYIFAHRGGMGLAPEHTMAAFKKAKEFNVDGFEVDVRMTKDEKLVVFHDDFIDRTSNGSGRLADHTLEELKALDFGYHFKDAEGKYPFRGHNDATIVTLEELLTNYPDTLINIDIKDHPETYEGSLVPSLLYRLISAHKAEDRVCVTSFHDEQIERFKLYTNESVALGAGIDQVRNAILLYNSGFGHLIQPNADTFQLPLEYNGVPLTQERLINFLQNLNIAVGYWVVNSIDEMDDLIQKGAHTIVTDYPDMSDHLLKSRY